MFSKASLPAQLVWKKFVDKSYDRVKQNVVSKHSSVADETTLTIGLFRLARMFQAKTQEKRFCSTRYLTTSTHRDRHKTQKNINLGGFLPIITHVLHQTLPDPGALRLGNKLIHLRLNKVTRSILVTRREAREQG